MGQPIKLIVKKGKLCSDGTRRVSVQYYHTIKKRVVLGTGIAIPPKCWNKKSSNIPKDLPAEFGNVEKLESTLTEKLRKAQDMIREAKKRKVCTLHFLKLNFPLAHQWKIEQLKENKNDLDVFHNIDPFTQERKSEVKQCTINVIGVMKRSSFRNILCCEPGTGG